MMIMAPAFIDHPLYEAAVAKARSKLGEPLDTLRLEPLTEGRSLQALHFGGYDDEGKILNQLPDELMPAQGLTFAGAHHEIYLSDPRKTPTEKFRTVLRQPVAPISSANRSPP